MRAFKAGFIELLLLAVLAVVAGFGVNATRTKGAIKPNKNYFVTVAAKLASGGGVARSESDGRAVERTGVVGAEVQPAENPYPILSPDEVVEIFNDPQTASGLNVFIDARNDQAFEEGHIPGAVQFFPYEVERFIDNVMARTNGVLRVIVYCNGGECTDSKYACRELLEMGVPDDAIFLFTEGWEAWTAKDMPIETGREEE